MDLGGADFIIIYVVVVNVVVVVVASNNSNDKTKNLELWTLQLSTYRGDRSMVVSTVDTTKTTVIIN